jgi:hypothetical protein
MNHSETKKLIVTTGVPSPNVFAERVSLVNENGQSISTKTDAELNSRYAPQQRWATGYYYLPADVRDVLVPTLNQMYAHPMEVWSAALDRIFVEVTSPGSAGSVMRLGIYAPNATTGLPDALLVDAGTIDGTSATAQEKTIAISSLVPGQIVWVAAVAQVAAPTVRALSATNGHPMVGATTMSSTIGASVKGAYYTATTVSGALPATFPVAGSVVKPPMIGLRAA